MIIFGIAVSFFTFAYEFFTSRGGVVLIPYGIIAPLLLLTPRVLYKYWGALRGSVKFKWVLGLESLGVLVILFNSIGTLYLHSHPFGFLQYDRLLHYLMGLITTIIAGLILVALGSRKKHILVISGFIIFLGVFMWELLQYSIDKMFDTKLFFDSLQSITIDFWEDISFGVFGILTGLIYLYKTFSKTINSLRNNG